ncbi:MAG: Citrate synthase (si), partial [uncultured Nocardioides sp.]
DRGAPRARGRRRLRDPDRRARQGGLRAALPRRRHRGARRAGALRERLGPARRRQLLPRPPAGRALQHLHPHRRRARRRPGRRRDARADAGHGPDLRHQRRAGPARPVARRGHGAVVRRAVGARPRPSRGPPVGGRPGPDAGRALPHPLAGRGRPAARPRDRRLLVQRRRARHERVHVHRARDHLHRCRRGRRVLRGHRRHVRTAARRCPVARPRDDRGGREVRRRDGVRQGAARQGRAPDGLRPPRLPRRGPPGAGAAPDGPGARRAPLRGRRGARAGRAQGAPRTTPGPRAGDQRRVLGGHRPRLRRGPRADVHLDVHLRPHRRLVGAHPRAEDHRPADPPLGGLRRPQHPSGRRGRGLEGGLGPRL